MKKRLIIIAFILCFTLFAKAQDGMQTILNSIEQNNTQLRALREMTVAEKLENKTANNLANPEVEVTHKPGRRGNIAETGIEATQSFDFPTAYKHRGQVIDMQNQRVDLAYEVKRKEVLQEARVLTINYIHQQRLFKFVEERTEYARELYAGYQKLFDKGEIDILERNKTKISLLELEKELQICEVDINSFRNELQRMNGGQKLNIALRDYVTCELPLEFDTWYARIKHNNPTLQMADKSVDMSRKQEQLTRSLNLPKLNAGYVGDLVKNDNRHGFLVSVSIPLWEGRNTIKAKKAQTLAMQYEKEDLETQYRNQLRANFEKAQKLSTLLKEYGEIVNNSNNFALLRKAFDMGKLTLIEYLQELILYHKAVDDYLSTEKDYQLALAELVQWENT